jgi:hypothetical protein
VPDRAHAIVSSGDQYLTIGLERIMPKNEDGTAAFSAAAAEITASPEQNLARDL